MKQHEILQLSIIQPHMSWSGMKRSIFQEEIFEKAGAYGIYGNVDSRSYGGSGMGYHEYVTLIETISIVDPSIGLSIAAHNSLCT